jgi:hypothetical protein
MDSENRAQLYWPVDIFLSTLVQHDNIMNNIDATITIPRVPIVEVQYIHSDWTVIRLLCSALRVQHPSGTTVIDPETSRAFRPRTFRFGP